MTNGKSKRIKNNSKTKIQYVKKRKKFIRACNNKSGIRHVKIRKKDLPGRLRKAKVNDKIQAGAREAGVGSVHELRKLCGIRDTEDDSGSRGTRPGESSKGLGSVTQKAGTGADDALCKTGTAHVRQRIPTQKAEDGAGKGVRDLWRLFKKGYISGTPQPFKAKNVQEPIPEATKSMYITIVDLATKEVRTLVVENFSDRFESSGQDGRWILMTDMIPKGTFTEGRRYTISTLCTNDPTPWTANDTVSLGYYRFRSELPNCECINGNNPLVFAGWNMLYRTDMLTPLREF